MLAELLGDLLEHADELAADALALQLGVGDALRLVEEALLRVDLDEVDAELALEDLLDLFSLVLAHAAVVDEHASKLLADRHVEQNGADGRIDAAGHRQQHLLVADLLPDCLDLLLDVAFRRPLLAEFRDAFLFRLLHNVSLWG